MYYKMDSAGILHYGTTEDSNCCRLWSRAHTRLFKYLIRRYSAYCMQCHQSADHWLQPSENKWISSNFFAIFLVLFLRFLGKKLRRQKSNVKNLLEQKIKVFVGSSIRILGADKIELVESFGVSHVTPYFIRGTHTLTHSHARRMSYSSIYVSSHLKLVWWRQNVVQIVMKSRALNGKRQVDKRQKKH